MKKSTKLMYQGVRSKKLRRELHEMEKRQVQPRFAMDHVVSKPRVVERNGVLVPYEGP